MKSVLLKTVLLAGGVIVMVAGLSGTASAHHGHYYPSYPSHCAPQYCPPSYCPPSYCPPTWSAPSYCPPRYCPPTWCGPSWYGSHCH
jgi:hypothetical protein